MGWHAVEWALRQDARSARNRSVLLSLAQSASNKNGWASWRRQEELAVMSGCSLRSVQEALKELRSLGLIRSEPRYRGGRRTTDKTLLLVDDTIGRNTLNEWMGLVRDLERHPTASELEIALARPTAAARPLPADSAGDLPAGSAGREQVIASEPQKKERKLSESVPTLTSPSCVVDSSEKRDPVGLVTCGILGFDEIEAAWVLSGVEAAGECPVGSVQVDDLVPTVLRDLGKKWPHTWSRARFIGFMVSAVRFSSDWTGLGEVGDETAVATVREAWPT